LRPRDQGIGAEPALGGGGALESDPSEERVRLARTVTGDPDHSVWNESTLSAEQQYKASGQDGHAGRWIAQKAEEDSLGRSWFRVLAMALVTGPWSILGALMTNSSSGAPMIAIAVFVAPVVEETMKVAIPFWALERRPWWFRGRAQFLVLGLAGGLAFAALENVWYLQVLPIEVTDWLIWWRWTVCVALHTSCSLLASQGLYRAWAKAREHGGRPDPNLALPWMLAAMILHGAYNAFAVGLEFTY
jgi:RsiW-degrading membrane proteinase PrsW (M82 family)